ncbi:MAG: hypothetical protein R3E32_04980 [Chitinophagales bacterium]
MNNSEDIQLLQSNPKELIFKYHSVLEKMLDKYIEKGKLPIDKRNEYLQIIQKQTVNRLLKLWGNYKEEAYVITVLAQAGGAVCKNLIDVHLLQNQDVRLIINYRSLSAIKVKYFVKQGFIQEVDADDVYQILQQKLLEKLHSGQLQQYQGTDGTLFSTYLNRIITNQLKDICKSLYKTKKRQAKEAIERHLFQTSPLFENLTQQFYFEEQIKMLVFLIQQYVGKEKTKLEICLKTYYRLLLNESDIYPLALTMLMLEEMLQLFNKQYVHWSNKLLWENLGKFIGYFEGKNHTSSNLRKWFTRKRNHIMVKLLLIVIHQRQVKLPIQWIGKESEMLQQITTNRDLVKYLDEWMGELVYRYYRT